MPRATDNALERATGSLLRHFRRQRPLRGGSLIITIFGDSIATRGGSISLASLIALARPFGLTERLVRTSVARLAKDGWLQSERRGRLSFYRLASHGRARFAEATRRIYAENPRDWNGRWTFVLLPKGSRAQRERLREEMLWLGFGQLASGLFAHPERRLEEVRAELHDVGVANGAMLLQATTGDLQEDKRLAATSWDLRELGSRYRRFVALFSAALEALHAGAEPPAQSAFIIRTLLIHEYRKIHLRDPLLPASLLPQSWVGAEAYELCRSLYARVFAAAESYLSENVTTAKGGLAPPSESAYRRFGGLPTNPAAS
jgi:phenylacetic acid degradation operon negative regulatory protein